MWRPRAFAEIFGGTKCCGKCQNSPKILLENVLILNENVNCHNTIVNMTLYIWDSGSQYLLFNIFTWKKPVYVSCKLLVFFQNLIDKKNQNFMAPFYGWGSTASRLQPLRGGSLLFTTEFPDILVLTLSTSEGWKAESTLEPPSGFEHVTPGLGIQRLNH